MWYKPVTNKLINPVPPKPLRGKFYLHIAGRSNDHSQYRPGHTDYGGGYPEADRKHWVEDAQADVPITREIGLLISDAG